MIDYKIIIIIILLLILVATIVFVVIKSKKTITKDCDNCSIVIDSGSFTPTFSQPQNGGNILSSGIYAGEAFYSRVGDIVTLSVWINFTPMDPSNFMYSLYMTVPEKHIPPTPPSMQPGIYSSFSVTGPYITGYANRIPDPQSLGIFFSSNQKLNNGETGIFLTGQYTMNPL